MALTSAAAPCVVIDLGATFGDIVLSLGVFAIPGLAIPVIARIARRNPSQTLLTQGRHVGGVRLYRFGLILFAASILAIGVVMVLGWINPDTCQDDAPVLAVFGILGGFLGALLIGAGWAWAVRATWVVLSTIAVLDVLIFYFNLLIGLVDPSAVRGLLLLAFVIHGICIALAARWSFVARDLGRVGRAKAGEAGRSLAAVWVFLASYTGLTMIRTESGIFDTAAGSAVVGALTLGALAVTMGSGFTKYAEAVYAEKPGSGTSGTGPGAPGTDSAADPVDNDASDAGSSS